MLDTVRPLIYCSLHIGSNRDVKTSDHGQCHRGWCGNLAGGWVHHPIIKQCSNTKPLESRDPLPCGKSRFSSVQRALFDFSWRGSVSRRSCREVAEDGSGGTGLPTAFAAFEDAWESRQISIRLAEGSAKPCCCPVSPVDESRSYVPW